MPLTTVEFFTAAVATVAGNNAAAKITTQAQPHNLTDHGIWSRVMMILWATTATENKKADVAEHPKAFHHVGLLVNGFSAVADYPLSSLPSDYRHLKIVLPAVTGRAA